MFRNILSTHHQPSTGSHSPYHSYKLCLLTNCTAGSPAVALDKSYLSSLLTASTPSCYQRTAVYSFWSSSRPESAVCELLETLNIRVQGVMQLHSSRHDQDPTKNHSPTPHFIVSVARGPAVLRVQSLTEFCSLKVTESYVVPRSPLQCKHCQRFGHTQCNCGHTPRCVECGRSQLSGECPTPKGQPKYCSCRDDHTVNYHGCVNWKEAKVALARQAPIRGQKNAATGHPATPKAERAEPSAEQRNLSMGRNHVVQGGRIVKATSTPTTPTPIPILSWSQRPLSRQM